MDRRRKVELFEQLRREYKLGVGTIKGVAGKSGVHRRLVRQALATAVRLQVFCMRNGQRRGRFSHRAYVSATQQAFLEAHELAFRYFTLASAVMKVP
jgi:hypothetical protein